MRKISMKQIKAKAAANGQIDKAREYLKNEAPDTKAAFESTLEQAEQMAQSLESFPA